MKDKVTTLAEIKEYIQEFSNARGWRKDQNAKDLVMALTVEAAELAEIFMWIHSDEADSVKEDPREFEHLQEEISDVFWHGRWKIRRKRTQRNIRPRKIEFQLIHNQRAICSPLT